jgi:hypothetical protein
MNFKTVLATSILLLVTAFNANAALVQMNFTGSISLDGSFSDPTGIFDQGDIISGFWLVETTTTDSDASTTRGAYAHTGAPAFQINIDSSIFQANSTTIQILDNHSLGIGTIDAYDVLGSAGVTSNISGLSVDQMQITLRDTKVPLDVFSSDALPLFAPIPADFDQIGQVQGQLTGSFNGNQFFMNLEIDNVSAVPVPAAIWLFGTALVGLVGFCGRKST